MRGRLTCLKIVVTKVLYHEVGRLHMMRAEREQHGGELKPLYSPRGKPSEAADKVRLVGRDVGQRRNSAILDEGEPYELNMSTPAPYAGDKAGCHSSVAH
jgi:hypothetical protein